MVIFPILNSIIFIIISGIHIYWAFGGSWGVEHVFPKTEEENKPLVFERGLFVATLVVAGGLLGFALVHLMAAGLLNFGFKAYLNYMIGGIAGIFLLRAIGDFNYLGLFKRVKNSSFSYYDSRIFVPLCLLIFVNAVITFVEFT